MTTAAPDHDTLTIRLADLRKATRRHPLLRASRWTFKASVRAYRTVVERWDDIWPVAVGVLLGVAGGLTLFLLGVLAWLNR